MYAFAYLDRVRIVLLGLFRTIVWGFADVLKFQHYLAYLINILTASMFSYESSLLY